MIAGEGCGSRTNFIADVVSYSRNILSEVCQFTLIAPVVVGSRE